MDDSKFQEVKETTYREIYEQYLREDENGLIAELNVKSNILQSIDLSEFNIERSSFYTAMKYWAKMVEHKEEIKATFGNNRLDIWSPEPIAYYPEHRKCYLIFRFDFGHALQRFILCSTALSSDIKSLADQIMREAYININNIDESKDSSIVNCEMPREAAMCFHDLFLLKHFDFIFNELGMNVDIERLADKNCEYSEFSDIFNEDDFQMWKILFAEPDEFLDKYFKYFTLFDNEQATFIITPYGDSEIVYASEYGDKLNDYYNRYLKLKEIPGAVENKCWVMHAHTRF